MNLKFNIGYHAELTEQANDGVLDQQQLGYVVAANVAQDLHQTMSFIHFDNCDFPGGIEHIAAQWAVIDSEADRHALAALTAFGALLHTSQDFYAHSNWVELHLDTAPIPVWDQTLASLPPAIVSGTWWIGRPKLCGPGAPSHDQLNKDSPTSNEGKKIVGSGPNAGKSYFDLAYAAAFAATKLLYARFAGTRLGAFEDQAVATAVGVDAIGQIIQAQKQLRACH